VQTYVNPKMVQASEDLNPEFFPERFELNDDYMCPKFTK